MCAGHVLQEDSPYDSSQLIEESRVRTDLSRWATLGGVERELKAPSSELRSDPVVLDRMREKFCVCGEPIQWEEKEQDDEASVKVNLFG